MKNKMEIPKLDEKEIQELVIEKDEFVHDDVLRLIVARKKLKGGK